VITTQPMRMHVAYLERLTPKPLDRRPIGPRPEK
jgi:hypothetical protein